MEIHFASLYQQTKAVWFEMVDNEMFLLHFLIIILITKI